MLDRLLHPHPVQRTDFHDEGHGYDLFGLHPPTAERIHRALWPFYRRYFRVASDGIENVPTTGAAILVANHGGALPIDSLMLWLDVNFRTDRFLRVVADRFIPRLPFVGATFSRCGVVSGTRSNVRLLLERKELLAIFPEGTTGSAKPSERRYQLQDWRVGHAELALEFRIPIVPVAIIGAEQSWPVWFKMRWRIFGAPYLPVPRTPIPLPIEIEIRYGKPMLADDGRDAANDPARVAALAARTRTAVEQLLARRTCVAAR